MDIDNKDISNDDLMDLKIHDDVLKLHMTFKMLSQSVENLEEYMYTGYMQFPSKDTLNSLTGEVNMLSNLVKGITDTIDKNGAEIIDNINANRGD